MKIVHTADWHIGKMINGYSLLDDQRYYFKHFIADLKEIKPDALLIAGDLYDRSIPSADAISLLNNILCEIVLDLGIETFIIAGNHDSKERLSFAGELLEKSGLHIAGNIDGNIKKVALKNQCNSIPVNIYLLPYIEPHNVKSLYKDREVKNHNDAVHIYCEEMLKNVVKDEINIILAHGLFQYGRFENSEEISVGGSEMVDISIFKEFDYCAFGHLHSHRTAGRKNMIFAGSPIKYSIDEANQKKSYTLLEMYGKGEYKISTKQIKPLRELRIIENTFEYIANRDNHKEDELNDYVFANLTDNNIALHAISHLKSVLPNILGLKYINLVTHGIDNENNENRKIGHVTEKDLFSQFYEKAVGEPIENEQMEFINEIFEQLKIKQR